jgi:hypothetical protein
MEFFSLPLLGLVAHIMLINSPSYGKNGLFGVDIMKQTAKVGLLKPQFEVLNFLIFLSICCFSIVHQGFWCLDYMFL